MDEVEWENKMREKGIVRYLRSQEKAVEQGRASETTAGARLLSQYVQTVSDYINGYLYGGGQRAQGSKVLEALDADVMAVIVLRKMMSVLYTQATAASLAKQVGRLVEDEIRFNQFEAEHKEYYDQIIRNLKDKGVRSEKFKRNSVIGSFRRQKGYEPEYWTDTQAYKIGMILCLCVVHSTDLFTVYKNRSKANGGTWFQATDECKEWVRKHNEGMSLLMPDRMPMIIPPVDWTNPYDGGYITPALREYTPLVIRNKYRPREGQDRYKGMPMVYKAVNALQQTAFRVNTRVLEVMQEVWKKNLGTGMPSSEPLVVPKSPLPEGVKASSLDKESELFKEFMEWKGEAAEIYTLEKERVSKMYGVSRTLQTAVEMKKFERFWYVWRLDSRGRFYTATTGLSPQGGDHGKALLEFAEGDPIDEFEWKVHGANKYGVDKVEKEKRVEFIDSRHDDWIAVARDPIGTREIWGAADCPYQFLAWCFEYEEYTRVGESFRSHLPAARDGSCNGLQHFAAMLRDEVGGRAVNLIPAKRPQDVYQEVGDVADEYLRADSSQASLNWQQLFGEYTNGRIPRSLPKPPVMTRPYGSTQRTCTSSIYRWLMANAKDFFDRRTSFRHCVFLTPIVWRAIDDVLISSRIAQKFIADCASIVGKANRPLMWRTPTGFPVYMRPMEMQMKRIETHMQGRVQVALQTETKKIDVRKIRSQSSPNFVHSLDASHMTMVVCRAVDEGVRKFWMVHDDFGIPSKDAKKFDVIIREEFVKLYSECPLTDFKKQIEARGFDLPEVPKKGNLDLNDVLRSEFFFA